MANGMTPQEELHPLLDIFR